MEAQTNNDRASADASPSSGRTRVINRNKERYDLFKKLVDGNFGAMLGTLRIQELAGVGVETKEDLRREAHLFRKVIDKAFQFARDGITERQQNPYFWAWRNAFVTGDSKALMTELSHSFVSFTVRQHLSTDAIQCHEKLADFRFPHEWFPATRTMQRTIHLHVGPTNSGKTYHALKALEKAKTGIYAGPLRLLAHEAYMRFASKQKRVALLTGEEQRIPEGDEEYIASCTVEMAPLNKRVDVAVIDEIQMIGDEFRGWAWTQAVLGIQAKEVHLCGEERAVPLIEALCAKTGDEVIIHRYQRLSPLQPEKKSLQGDFKKLSKGDAVVSFSRVNIHALKTGIEKATGRKCAIVYGSLPPETRAQQAALFNDPNNDYDYLAASDAIGMGLNLEVKRVIFESISKYDGNKMRALSVPELKQIGGRAGRYRTAAQAMQTPAIGTTTSVQATEASSKQETVGYVTSLEEADLDTVLQSFELEAPPMKTAGLHPPASIIEKFAAYFPAGTPFTFILLRLRDIARMSGNFHMCSFRDMIEIARAIQEYPLSIQDRCVFLNAPITMADFGLKDVLLGLANRVAYNLPGDILNVNEINFEILDHSIETYPAGRNMYLRHLEALHKALTLYLWLSYRFSTVFRSQSVAFHAKTLVEDAINIQLERTGYSSEARAKRLAAAREAIQKQHKKAAKVFGDDHTNDQGVREHRVPEGDERLQRPSMAA